MLENHQYLESILRTQIESLEADITHLKSEISRLQSDEDDSLTAVYMAGRHDGRKQRLDAEAEQLKQEAAELRSALSGRNQEVHIADMYTTYDGRVDIVPTGTHNMTYYLNGKRLVPEPEPVADADTLEKLAEIGIRAYEADDTNNHVEAWCAAVTAILRAAKPRADVGQIEMLRVFRSNIASEGRETLNEVKAMHALREYLNSRIRYTVAAPQSEPTDEEIEELARRIRMGFLGCDNWDSCDVLESTRNNWCDVALDAWDHLKGGA